jgi:hypothetical protein
MQKKGRNKTTKKGGHKTTRKAAQDAMEKAVSNAAQYNMASIWTFSYSFFIVVF